MAYNSIFSKIRKHVFFIVVAIMMLVTIIIGVGLYVIRYNVTSANNILGASAANDAKQTLIKQIEEALLLLADNRAAVGDEKFANIAEHINIITQNATHIRSNPREYGRRNISFPDTSNKDGKVTVMMQISENTSLSALRSEIDLMANIQDLLLAIQTNNNSVGTTYISTEAGITICADPDSAQKTPFFNCRTRMWYINAKAANKQIWTDVFEDYLGRGLAITCAKPFYDAGGNIAGVAGMGMFLDTLKEIVVGTVIGETGYAFMINEKSEVIISNNLSKDENGKILREKLLESNSFPKGTAERMISGASGIERIVLNGDEKLIAYRGLTNIPWSFAVVIDVDEVITPALRMEDNIFNLKQKNLDSIGSVIFFIGVSSIFLLLLIIFGTSYISNRLAMSLTNPIFKLTEDAMLIGSGKLDHLPENKTSDELEVLTDTFNIMIGNIKKISAEKEFAEQSNRYKSAFLANMSHEIRTPMNAILGIAEIQMQNNFISSDAKDAFNKIYESGDLLLIIINDILDLSKIEAGKLELLPCEYDIPSLINDTAQLNRIRYENKPIIFNLHVDENTPNCLFGDALRIKQILNNMLSNAYKYTEKGRIDFYVSSENKSEDEVILIFSVSDTGQGMTKDQINIIFDEYTRFNTEANRTTIGAGLGMSITKRLLDLMNGEISVESNPGEGSVFTVRIPQKRLNSSVCGDELVKNLRNFNYNNTAIAKRQQFIREYMPYGNVLVVDDVESNIYVIKGMLMLYGLKIETASSGLEAINKIKSGSIYDIIFMDHMMPELDGVEAVKIIRNMKYKRFIIALTANALIGQEEMFLSNGFDGYISKPIDSRELNHCLNEFIRNKKPPEVVEEARQKQRDNKQEGIAILDNSNVIKFFLQDARNAVNLLEALYKIIDNLESTAVLGDDDIGLYITTVHGIKSALANIGEAGLSDTASKLEKAGRENNTGVMLAETPVLTNALKSLIEKLTPKEDAGNVEITEKDKLFLKEKLLEVKTSCGEMNKKDAKKALNELKQKKWPAEINAALDKIETHLLHSEFSEASETAENIDI